MNISISSPREDYMIKKREIDNTYYWAIRDDLPFYNNEYKEINDILDKYRKLIDSNTYYIKGNYLLFTYQNNKYCCKISNYLDEQNYITSIYKELNMIGCKNIIYVEGDLD